ncbi:MAG TPA: hypothetical protein DEG43_06925 [Acidimicrobiaceae bacterium]|nr:hypothetical protein [Acidimicrobiaceae bacterium]
MKETLMAVQRTSFEKLQRDRAKKAKGEAKRARKLAGPDPDAPVDPSEVEALLGSEDKELSAGELLELIEKIHKQFEAEEITFEEFEDRKLDLFARLPLD